MQVLRLPPKCPLSSVNLSFISLRTSRRRPEHAQPHMRNGLVELWRENAIAIMNEKTVAMVRRDGFPQLLSHYNAQSVGSVFDNDQYLARPSLRLTRREDPFNLSQRRREYSWRPLRLCESYDWNLTHV